MSLNGCKWLLAIAFLALPGCGSDLVPVYSVKGKISGGQGSLKGMRIIFTPSDPNGLSSSGVIEDGDVYTLESLDGRKGAVVGKHKVSFVLTGDAMQEAMKSMAKDPPKSGIGGGRPGMMNMGGPQSAGAKGAAPGMSFKLPVPQSYSSPVTSPKEVEVKAGDNVIDISI